MRTNLITTIALRNLVRQKRRNILLGIAIAFGTAILILANSFSHGISHVLFDKVMKYVAGHISVGVYERGNYMRQIMRDGDWVMDLVKSKVPDVTQLQEAIGIFARGLGNGKSDNVILVGIDLDSDTSKATQKETAANFPMAEGTWESLRDTANGKNPVLIAQSKAKYLNLKMGDALKVRFSNVLGQSSTATLTITGIVKPSNVFMEMPVYLNVVNLKKIVGYGPHDIGQVYVLLKNPKKNAILYADKLHDLLKPDLAFFTGTLSAKGRSVPGVVAGFRSDSAGRTAVLSAISMQTTDTGSVFFKKGVLVSDSLGKALSLGRGDTLRLTYLPKRSLDSVSESFAVTGTYSAPGIGSRAVLVNDAEFYRQYYEAMPLFDTAGRALLPGIASAQGQALAPQWFLMDRSRSTSEVTKRFREISGRKYKGTIVDVSTMYETASMILQLESALNLITFAAVMILFFIILIGVVNTLRMTIRERTREIGTIRAIGMQRTDVRNTFLMETGLLALFSALTGTVLAFISMWALSSMTIKTDGNPLSMLLVNGHLFFAPTVVAVIFFIVLIVGIAVATAFFPANRATKLNAAVALRHYE